MQPHHLVPLGVPHAFLSSVMHDKWCGVEATVCHPWWQSSPLQGERELSPFHTCLPYPSKGINNMEGIPWESSPTRVCSTLVVHAVSISIGASKNRLLTTNGYLLISQEYVWYPLVVKSLFFEAHTAWKVRQVLRVLYRQGISKK